MSELQLNSFHTEFLSEIPESQEYVTMALQILLMAKEAKKESGYRTKDLLFEAINLLVKQKFDGYPMTQSYAEDYVKPLLNMLQEGVMGRSVQ